MKYKNPNIESSYRDNDIGKTLYDLVIELKPKNIVEFGTLNGYSAISMGMALHELGGGKIICYDLWDLYKYKHTTIESTQKNIDEYGLSEYIELHQKDIKDFNDFEFDLLHIDISNDGDTIEYVYELVKDYLIKNNKTMIFEGGSIERDNIEWMVKYNKRPIVDIIKNIQYKVLNNNFPSLSIII
jgi:predicted O-methyltransferase YrrM